MSAKYVIFKPRERERSFLVSVLFMTMRMLFFVVLLIGLSCGGLMVGVAKAWMDTTPDAGSGQDRTRRRRPRSSTTSTGDLITEYKGSENRIYVELDEIPQEPHQRRHLHRGRALLRAPRHRHQATSAGAYRQQPHGRQHPGRVHDHLPAGQADACSPATRTISRKVQEAYLAAAARKTSSPRSRFSRIT